MRISASFSNHFSKKKYEFLRIKDPAFDEPSYLNKMENGYEKNEGKNFRTKTEMHRLKVMKFLGFAVLFVVANLRADVNTPSFAALLPKENVVADLMIMSRPEEFEKIARKMQLSVNSKPEWFGEYMKEVPSIKTMPYHPNLGITKAEYKIWTTLKKSVKPVKSGEIEIIVKLEGESLTLAFEGIKSQELPITIDLSNGTLKTENFSIERPVLRDARKGPVGKIGPHIQYLWFEAKEVPFGDELAMIGMSMSLIV